MDFFESILIPSLLHQKKLGQWRWNFLNPYFLLPKKNWASQGGRFWFHTYSCPKKIGPVEVEIFQSILPPSQKILGQLRWNFLNPYSRLPTKIGPVEAEVLESILTPAPKKLGQLRWKFLNPYLPLPKKIGQLRWTFLNPYLVLLKKTLGQSRWNKLFLYITFQQFIWPSFKVWWLFYKISFWTFMGLVAFIAFPLALFLAQNLFDKAFWPRSGHKKQNCLELLEAAIFFGQGFCTQKKVQKPPPIIWHHMMQYDGQTHHMMAKSHHMMAPAHHMMDPAHHMMAPAHHMTSYDAIWWTMLLNPTFFIPEETRISK